MRRTLTLLTVMLLLASFAGADGSLTGQVTGTTKTLDGTPLPGVVVSLAGDRGTSTAVTDENGAFRFAAVIAGAYTLSATMEGMQAPEQEVQVSSGERSDAPLVFADTVADTILVTGAAPMVNRFDTSGGGTLQAAELEAVSAVATRNYKANLLALPGVRAEGSTSQGNRPSAEGVEGARQMYLVDGVDVSFSRWGGGSQLQVPSVAIQEVKMQTSGADAEYSRTIGAYTTATVKSGTNAIKGSFELMGQDLSWNAQNENVPEERPSDTELSWQAAAGGPIYRDKVWFFLAAKEDKNPAFSIMASGDAVTEGSLQDARLLKLDAKPSNRHNLSLSYVETPWDFPWWNANTYWDIETVTLFEYPGDLLSARWNWTTTDSLLIEANVSTTEPEQNRVKYVENTIDTNCAPNQPCGNAWVYRPFDGDRSFRNGIGLPLGAGFTNFPRDQGNVSVNWFKGNHDVKFGIDVQETAWELGGVVPPLCRGRGYNPNAPGGFDSNVSGTRAWCSFFPTQASWQEGYGPVTFEQSSQALFLRDRFTTNKWTFNLGVRVDQQKHDNDIGSEVLDATDIVPRASASYDLNGNGKLLLKASAGRYVSQVEQSWTRNFNTLPVGRDQYERYSFNRDTGEYDILTRVFTAGGEVDVIDVQPPFKDEYTVGLDWQFLPNWAFKAQAVVWERNGAPDVLDQFDADGRLFSQAEDTPGVRMEHEALHLSVQRRFKDNWMLSTSYSLSSTEGNCWYSDNGGCASAYSELRSFTNDDGTPWSEFNRWGNLREDRPNSFKLRGAYRFELGGGHSINVGGLFWANSGHPWNPTQTLTAPPELDTGNTGTSVTVFTEPRGSRRTPSQMQLDMNLSWRFPIQGRYTAGLRLEAINVTDEQEVWGISGLATTGQSSLTSANFQRPRRLRAVIAFRF